MRDKGRWQFRPADEFANFSEAWDLLNQVQGFSPVLEARFVSLLLQHFGSGSERLAIYGEGNNTYAAALIVPTKMGAWATFQPSQAPIGLWLKTPSLDLRDLMGSLLKALPRYPILFSVLQQDPQLAPRVDNGVVRSMDYISTASITINGTFEEYWAERGKNLRNNLRRQRNVLQREGVSIDFRALTDPAGMRTAVAAYGELESKGWKNSSNTAIHINNRQGRFYADLLEAFAATGNAVAFQLFYNDVLVAMDLCITGGDTMVMLKTTYDQEKKGTSPAMLLHQEEFSYLFGSRDCSRVEFLGRLMEWHTKWTNDVRTLFHLNIYRNRLVALLRNR